MDNSSITSSIRKYDKPHLFINMNNKLIDDNINYRRAWEEDCKQVQLAYRGNKFPVKLVTKNASGTSVSSTIHRSQKAKGYLNLVKRQWRVIANYLMNNEPQYLITKKEGGVGEEYIEETREALNLIFDGSDDENAGFYDTVMDDTIFYGVHRGICWTMIFFLPDEKQFRFKSIDPMDTYVDVDADSLDKIQKFLHTYNLPKGKLRKDYPVDGLGNTILWDEVGTDQERTASDVKKSMMQEKQGHDSLLVREGYYIDYGEDGKASLLRVLTTNTIFLKMEVIADMEFVPVTWFAPISDPGEIYPKGWFVDMLPLEREVNEMIMKMATIVKTGGRYVYVQPGTKITKTANNFINSLGIEVLEVSAGQKLPEQATLMQITQSDVQFLEMMLNQAEEEGGMKGDIMGTSSTGANASGRAIQALQAGSKNNIGTALNELNKYMNRLVRILLRMMKIFPTSSYYSEKTESEIEIGEEKEYDKKVKIKVSVTGRDAFDEVTQVLNAIDILNMIQKFNPQTNIPPKVITKLMGVTNDIADDIEDELSKQEDPDMQIAEGQAKKMLQGIPQNASENDNHQLFIAVFSEALKAVPPDSPAAECLMDAIRTHEAFGQSAG